MPGSDDRVASTLAEAKRIADGLQFACILPGRTPDFTFCGGPAAEAYWDYFTPARITALIAAIERALRLADEWEADSFVVDPEVSLRERVRAALAGKEAGDGN